MKAVQLVSAKDLQLVDVDEPDPPRENEVLVEILSVGICGSDLHMYETGTIGTIEIAEPMILGHEFSARILEVPTGTINEYGQELKHGMRVAVEPHVACRQCEQCLAGNPNLCLHHYFYGVYPTHGSLCERMVVRASNCFPVPDSMSNDSAALLEPLGIAVHSLDLAKIRIGETVAVIGCGPVGALIARLAVLAGASRVYAFDLCEWRSDLVQKWGANAYCVNPDQAPGILQELTSGRGADVVFEAAWSDHSVQQAVDMAAFGGRLIMVGIPPDDRFTFSHSPARRKGLTIRMVRRMKNTYPRAVQLANGSHPAVDTKALVSHTFNLEDTANAFQMVASYSNDVVKAIVRVAS